MSIPAAAELELIPAQEIALKTFTGEEAAQAMVAEIRAKALLIPVDISTDKGRKSCASIALKIAKSKTFLDDCGKSLVEGQKKEIKKIDDLRKMIRDGLDAFKEEYRKPLTEFEEREEKRQADFQARIKALREVRPASTAAEILEQMQAFGVFNRDGWDEFAEPAAMAHATGAGILFEAHTAAEKREAEAIELARLRKEAAENEARQREEKIRREAEERGRIEAERKAVADLEAANRRAAAAEIAQRQAEARVAAPAPVAPSVAKSPAPFSDVEHKRGINREIMAHLCGALEVPEELARKIVVALAKGAIPNVSINY
jgi:hypothetical protein